MKASTYCIFQILSGGDCRCIEEIATVEEARERLLFLEAIHPGDYVAINSDSGKLIRCASRSHYVC